MLKMYINLSLGLVSSSPSESMEDSACAPGVGTHDTETVAIQEVRGAGEPQNVSKFCGSEPCAMLRFWQQEDEGCGQRARCHIVNTFLTVNKQKRQPTSARPLWQNLM